MEIKTEECLKDPKTANARIFVGGLSPKVKDEDLRERFEKHGDILGTHFRNTLSWQQCNLFFWRSYDA